MANKNKKDAMWKEAQRRCRLTDEALAMAKQLGIGSKSLIRNIPSKSQAWKATVETWVRDMHAERFGGHRSVAPVQEPAAADAPRFVKTELDVARMN